MNLPNEILNEFILPLFWYTDAHNYLSEFFSEEVMNKYCQHRQHKYTGEFICFHCRKLFRCSMPYIIYCSIASKHETLRIRCHECVPKFWCFECLEQCTTDECICRFSTGMLNGWRCEHCIEKIDYSGGKNWDT